jgi:single-strand DNA-binding protein
MASLNKVILLGNLTRDPELRYTPNGTPVATMGLAVNRRYRQGDETKEEVCFVDVVTFGRQAETVSEYLQKGRPALVEGRLQWRSWESEDGQRRSKHEVVAERVQFLPSSAAGREGGRDTAEAAGPPRESGRDAAEAAGPPPYDTDDDIPFVRPDSSDLAFDDRCRSDMRA